MVFLECLRFTSQLNFFLWAFIWPQRLTFLDLLFLRKIVILFYYKLKSITKNKKIDNF